MPKCFLIVKRIDQTKSLSGHRSKFISSDGRYLHNSKSALIYGQMFLTANSDQPLSIFWVLNSSVVNTFLRSSKIIYRNLNLHYLYLGKCTLPIRIWVYVSEIGVYTYRVPSTRYKCPSCICISLVKASYPLFGQGLPYLTSSPKKLIFKI